MQQWTLFFVSWLATVSAGLSATLFGVYLPPMVQALYPTATRQDVAQVGSFAGAAFLFGWAVGGLLLGGLGDRLGRKVAFVTSTLACSLGMLGTAFVQSLASLVLWRIITGAGAGGILLATAVLASETWAKGNRARVVGILINAFPLGFVLTGLFQASIADFRTAYALGSLSILLVFLILLFVRESEIWQARKQTTGEFVAARSHLFQPQHRKDLAIGVGLYGSMLIGLWAAYTWIPAWVSSLSIPVQAQGNRSLSAIALGIGAFVGGLISGAVSNTLGRKRAAAVGYIGVFTTSAILFVTIHEITPLLFALAFVLSFFIGFNQGILSAYIPELFPTHVRATATGISFNVGRLLTTIAVFFVGVLIQVLGGYDRGIFTFAFAYLIGLMMLIPARETRGNDLPR
ncbi:MFS transporter [Chroococcidiopsis sp [FACHB-1243]]|uniref:MFS transporter n=1 Tax=Chroococcidiopsis sp. [FACHB-1243] TaxID=2692781 RepID=UPI0024116957|nr:MFS transporter [Chroococcidiopsis sp. [FACHB-1243]]